MKENNQEGVKNKDFFKVLSGRLDQTRPDDQDDEDDQDD